ncbi:alpha/beta hydrolase [Pseudomonas gingeri]|uniref:Alpha/beta hydrolase n=1 Tax=Pseudomonas gingeri TaxID=117681 RepID=A0A7Y7YBQ1_9PSED|nr:alpha/beta hydrolase [Pseudomonas gingeri]NWA04374.1 alpha/beta hydrolase [Pseudomonas gingeri]NWA15649.1 alpha/beta hydrolase [Pseudomonas gingeri]NWA58179.1 alpha/beta hydrolase [Pseudomonas gingeri]NWA96145.1 alpha/beta hydrolase [Pseudomonas gingeri]NWB04944.1 alpha/beta hydrolase [Pseudomonas gingeri]
MNKTLFGSLLLGMCVIGGQVQAAEHGVKEVSPNHLKLSAGELSVGLNRDWLGPMPDVQRVLIIVHGRLRNAMTYLNSAETAAAQAGQDSNTLIIAPQFLNESDVRRNHLPDNLLRWQGNDWMAGEASTGPSAMSSYAALDEVLQRLGNRKKFPALREVVIAGHSGGGQVVQRYALVGHGDTQLAGSGIKLRYVIANPSSYAYFNAQRPVAGFNPSSCPGFNDWKYGLQNLPSYAMGQSPAQLEKAYVQRDITYLLGQQDTDPNHPALDKSCEAEAQGPYRLIRGHNYFAYLQQRHPQGLAQTLVEVPGVGHNGDGMFTSPQGQKALFQR